jgi:hypothetical protein
MSKFDLGKFVKASTKASGVPEKLSDWGTVVGVVRLLRLAK